MGYYAKWTVNNLRVKLKNRKACLNAINEMMTDEGMEKYDASGGSFGFGGERDRRWYSWMNDVKTPFQTLEEAFESWTLTSHDGGKAHTDDETGDMVFNGFHDSKIGDEEVFLVVIAPFVEDIQIECTGEDGTRWVWEIKDGKFSERPVT